MTKLSVNLNKVALLRNQRGIGYPSVVKAARIVLSAGAHGVTVHPRPDERHIRKDDVFDIAALLKSEFTSETELNIEGNPTPEFLELVERISPHQVTLVPDAPDAWTSDEGWDVAANAAFLEPIIKSLKEQDIRTVLFLNADIDMIPHAAAIGADRVELYTGPYAFGYGGPDQSALLKRYQAAALAAKDAGLGVNAGHDLNLDNLSNFLRAAPMTAEVSIGHALTADALWMGFAEAVRTYLRLMGEAR